MKKILSITIILVLTLLFSINVFAQNSSILTLQDVINTSIENNTQLIIDEMNIKNAKEAYEITKDEADNIYISAVENTSWDVAFPDPAYCTSQRKAKELSPEQRDVDIDYYRKLRDSHELKIKVDAYNIYYSLIKAERNIKFKTDYAELVNRKLEISKQKYENGLISKNDYELIVLENENSQIEVELAMRDRKKYISKLYLLMGKGYQPDIKDLEELLEYSKLEASTEEAIKNAFENRLEVFESNKNEELKKLEFEIVDRYYEDDELSYFTAINEYETAKLNADIKRDSIEYEIRTSYNNLLNSLDTIKINNNEVQKTEILYFISKLKYNLKMITEFELSQSKIEHDRAKLNLDNSIMDYIVDKFEFEAAQSVGIGTN